MGGWVRSGSAGLGGEDFVLWRATVLTLPCSFQTNEPKICFYLQTENCPTGMSKKYQSERSQQKF